MKANILGILLLAAVFLLVGVFAVAAYKGAYDGAHQAFEDYITAYYDPTQVPSY